MKRSRGRPKLSIDAQEFRREIARQLRAAIDSRNLTVKAAADVLGVSRQAFYKYLSGAATPHPETIARAMDLWNIEPHYKGEKIMRGAFGEQDKQSPPPVQMSLASLFDIPQECHNENLVITVQRSRSSLLHLTIKMKRAGEPMPHLAMGITSKTG